MGSKVRKDIVNKLKKKLMKEIEGGEETHSGASTILLRGRVIINKFENKK